MRPLDGLFYLRHADKLLSIVDQLAETLVARAGLTETRARRFASRLHGRKIAATYGHLPNKTAVHQALREKAFGYDPITRPEVQNQIRDFRQMFTADTTTRVEMEPKLKFIRDAQRAIDRHHNHSVGKRVETI